MELLHYIVLVVVRHSTLLLWIVPNQRTKRKTRWRTNQSDLRFHLSRCPLWSEDTLGRWSQSARIRGHLHHHSCAVPTFLISNETLSRSIQCVVSVKAVCGLGKITVIIMLTRRPCRRWQQWEVRGAAEQDRQWSRFFSFSQLICHIIEKCTKQKQLFVISEQLWRATL